MKKPHEQEWRLDGSRYIERRDNAETVAKVSIPSRHAIEDEVAHGRFIAAAPDMARELLHLLRLMEPLEKDGGLDIPGLATLNGARAALKKAGVLP